MALVSPANEAEAPSADVRESPAAEEVLGLISGTSAPSAPSSAKAKVDAEDAREVASTWASQPAGERLARVGRVHAFEVPVFGLVYIGPHWYCSILMFAFVTGVGYFFTTKIAVRVGWHHIVVSILVTFMSTRSFVKCALGDPGILLPATDETISDVAVQYLPSNGSRRCRACNIVQPRGAYHCEWCEVCIEGWDHHCPWMNKCIGRKNHSNFRCFLTWSLPSLIYMVVVIITAPLGMDD
eukprot:TRINITY_DN20494_c0_g1_i1.p1 TRINITY_DN20494_c0_g1~~TRINITY_DN20494_c0_g1_i1.p1  ORF type:complete len:273 (-),score=31.38 TRINITY_DN20494_c0_g1_i1:87-806(-)